MTKTYLELRKILAEKRYIDMEIPHPNGSVYLLTEEKDQSSNEVFRCELASKNKDGNWIATSISKRGYDHSNVSCAMSDLDNAFRQLMPTI